MKENSLAAMSLADFKWRGTGQSPSQTEVTLATAPMSLSMKEYLLAGLATQCGAQAFDCMCGKGGTSMWLALRGFKVFAIDPSESDLSAAANASALLGLSSRITYQRGDLESGLDIDGSYQVVLCHHLHLSALHAELYRLTSPGGLL